MDPPCSDEEQVKGKSLQTRRLDAPATLLGTHFRDGFAILSRVRRTEIHPGREVTLHGLPTPHGTGIRALHVKFVPEICELVLRGTGEAIFDKQIAAGPDFAPQPFKITTNIDDRDELCEQITPRTVSRLTEMCDELPVLGHDRRMDPSAA